jgi:hypothetical protein
MASVFISPEGIEFEKKIGRKKDVWEMTAYQTSSGLLKDDLKLNRRGRVVSKLRSQKMAERFKKYGGLKKKTPEQAKKESKAYMKIVKDHADRLKRHAVAVQRDLKIKEQRQAIVRQKRRNSKK